MLKILYLKVLDILDGIFVDYIVFFNWNLL